LHKIKQIIRFLHSKNLSETQLRVFTLQVGSLVRSDQKHKKRKHKEEKGEKKHKKKKKEKKEKKKEKKERKNVTQPPITQEVQKTPP